MNIVDPILVHARYDPNALAICTPGTEPPHLTFGELEGWINNINRLAVSLDLARGQMVAVYVAEKILHLAIVLALARMGIPTTSPRSPVLSKALNVSAVIADRPAPFENAGRVILTDATWKRPHQRSLADARFYQTADGELCRIAETSGTTGDARGIGFSHALLAGRIHRYEFVHGAQFAACRRLYCDFGIQSGLGFQTMLFALSRGAALFLFGSDSASMVQAFDLYKVDAMFTAPNGLAQYLQFFELPGAPESSFEVIVALGAQLPRGLATRALAHMTPNLLTAYGSTECGQTVAAHVKFTVPVEGAVGFVLPDATVEIVDDAGKPLPPGREGHVRINTEHSVTEYLGDPAASAETFRDGWFYPGDLGTLTAERMLTIGGRSKALINMGGDKIKPELVEEVLISYGKVKDAAVFEQADALGIPELCAAVVAPASVDVAALQNICAARLGAAYAPKRFFQVAALPRNEGGKLDRARLPTLAERGPQSPKAG